MAKTTDELFAEATEADYETAEPVTLAASDTEEEFQFRIDEHLRTIAIPEKGVVAGVEGDLNVNIARFTMTRYYHGRDLSKLNIRINYRNANGQVNYYTVSDATVSGDSIVFSWEFAADVTQYKGNVQFVVYLFSATNAVLKQRFFTTLGTLEVLEGLEVDSSIPVSEQTDILLHLKKDLSAYAEEVKKSLPADYTAMTEQVNSLKEDLGEVVSKFEDKLVNIEFNYSIGVYDKAHKLNTGVGINAEIPVKAGQNYVISCHNYNANVPCYLVFNENYTLIESYGNDVTNEDKHLAITIPLGGSRLIINSYDINKTYVLKKQLVSVSEFVDSENQYVDVTPQIMNGYIDYKKDVYQSAGCHVLFNVTEGEKYKVDGLNFSEGYPLGFCYRKDGANMQTLTGFGNQTRVHGYEFTVPNGAVEVAINSDDIKCLRVYKYKKPSTEEIARKNIGIKNKGKKIVWFGTSIPAGCYNPSDLHTSYPMIIGDRLGITVYNEAVPSSPVHGMRKSQITESNPYGFFAESFSAACLALACTLEEKEWLISHWNDSFWTGGKYTSMTETQAEYIRNTSYEKKLDKYLNADNFPDAFVFDVGRNDIWGDEDATYTGYDRYTFPNAMHFLIDRIYRYRKDAKIIIIGHYSNQERSKNDTVVDFPQKVAKCQSDISDMWMLPICKTWEKTGWTNQSVYSSGSSKSMLAWNLPDQLHPHSDTSGKATRHMADIICPFIRDNI